MQVARVRRSAAPTTAPIRPASTTPSSSSPCCRSEWPVAAGHVASPHQGRTGRRHEQRPHSAHRGRRLELLAEHSRQRASNRSRASKAKTRSRSSVPNWPSWRSSATRWSNSLLQIRGIIDVACSTSWANRTSRCRSTAPSRRLERHRADVQNVVQTAIGGLSVDADDRRRTQFDVALLARAVARQRG